MAGARALAMWPRILLMDEPFAALDALTRRRMQEELQGLWDEAPFTLLLSPHPGRVRAEINAHQFDLHSQGSAAFQTAAPSWRISPAASWPPAPACR